MMRDIIRRFPAGQKLAPALFLLIQKERRIEIETVVRKLPATYRELVILRHSQDLTYEEIVEVTGLPLGTVKNRLFRAREMMRQQFVEKGITGI